MDYQMVRTPSDQPDLTSSVAHPVSHRIFWAPTGDRGDRVPDSSDDESCQTSGRWEHKSRQGVQVYAPPMFFFTKTWDEWRDYSTL